jgi:hypothetical protein
MVVSGGELTEVGDYRGWATRGEVILLIKIIGNLLGTQARFWVLRPT